MPDTSSKHPKILLVALSLFYGGVSMASCPSGWLEIERQSADGNVFFVARNQSEVPITFTMSMGLRKFSASRATSFTESLQPHEFRQVMTLTHNSSARRGRYQFSTRCAIGNKDADHDDDVVYRLPYENGMSYRVLQSYGSRFSHTGREAYAVDFRMPEGTPVHAARGGIVARIEESHSKGCWHSGCGAYANYIVVLHDDDTTGAYYHLQKNGVLVEPGQKIVAGEHIGFSGNTGHTTMPHLHFAVYRAVSRGREQSIPIRYLAASGVINRPRPGWRYQATQDSRISRSASHNTNKTF